MLDLLLRFLKINSVKYFKTLIPLAVIYIPPFLNCIKQNIETMFRLLDINDKAFFV